MLQVLGDGTYGGLHQQLSHPVAMMLPCLAPWFTVICVFPFSFLQGNCIPVSAHFQVFLRFIPAVPLLVFIATDENYCRVVEMFGYHICFKWLVLIQKRIK